MVTCSELAERILVRIDQLRSYGNHNVLYPTLPPSEETLRYIEDNVETLAGLFMPATGIGIFPGDEGEIRVEYEVAGRMLELTIQDYGAA